MALFFSEVWGERGRMRGGSLLIYTFFNVKLKQKQLILGCNGDNDGWQRYSAS
jgi:hypothetical protein